MSCSRALFAAAVFAFAVPAARADDSPGFGRPEVGGIHGRVSPL